MSIPCGPAVNEGGRARRPPASALTQTWPKFGPGMGRAGRVGSTASYRWSVRNWRAGLVGCVRTRADAMRRPGGDALM
jgi:hypothetical protein